MVPKAIKAVTIRLLGLLCRVSLAKSTSAFGANQVSASQRAQIRILKCNNELCQEIGNISSAEILALLFALT